MKRVRYEIEWACEEYGLRYDGEEFREGSFDVAEFETFEEALAEIKKHNFKGAVKLDSEFRIIRETFLVEEEEFDSELIQVIPSVS